MANLITVTNCETGETIEREMNADELAQFNLIKEEQAQQVAAEAQKATAKLALLARLGITEEEAQLLLGSN
jgi:hypothetical protein